MANSQVIGNGVGFKDLATYPPFGSLRAIRVADKNRHRQVLWECLCDEALGGCGSTAVVAGHSLRSGHTRSCGCLSLKLIRAVNATHGMSNKPEYRIWFSMKQRCVNPRDKRYMDYGGRGISVCQRWLDSFENFYADMGDRPSRTHSIERKNNDGDYTPSNCVWATKQAQARNQRRTHWITLNGRTMSMMDWSEHLGISYFVIRARLARGWSVERALTTPVK